MRRVRFQANFYENDFSLYTCAYNARKCFIKEERKIRSRFILSFYVSECDCSSLRKLVLSNWYHSQRESLLLKPPKMLYYFRYGFHISTILCSLRLASHFQISYLSIQVEKVKTFGIQNGIGELSKPTLWNETSMPSKDQKLHYIL